MAESRVTPLFSGQRVSRVTIRDLSDTCEKPILQGGVGGGVIRSRHNRQVFALKEMIVKKLFAGLKSSGNAVECAVDRVGVSHSLFPVPEPKLPCNPQGSFVHQLDYLSICVKPFQHFILLL